ncbi:peptidase inhibitor family I36 protein [Streptomyces sp. NPDC127038]|uniref:peptidase inhibitor family I36 protein n=1 Tax=Streptomyces sp. NPDC127038 TaxID=3347114 RepID=UPI0036687ED0
MKRKLASVALVGGLAFAGMAATAPTASAVGGCPSGKLCLYEPVNYARLDVTSTSTKACINLAGFGPTGFAYGIGSYVNNLSVKAAVYHAAGTGYVYDGTISPGGFSSNSSSTSPYFGNYGLVCTGGATP